MTALTPLTILIVDDSPEDRAVCSRFLSRHSAAAYNCIEAVTGTEGLAFYRSARPDCLVLDFSLPDMDGLQFLTAMHAEAHPQSCPVVLLTGQGSEQIAVQALHCGAQDYLVKEDLSAVLLHRTITTAIEKFRLHQMLEEHRRVLHQQNLALRQREECLSALNAMLERRVAERMALLGLLQDITIAANESTSSADAIQFALDRICAYIGWPVGHAYLVVAPGVARWAPTPIWHLETAEQYAAFQQATQTAEFGVDEGLIGQVGGLKKPVWNMDVSTDPTFCRRHAVLAAGLKAGFAFPILVEQEVAGILEFYANTPLAPNLPLCEALTPIGTQLGRVIERERAVEELQHKQEALRQREKLVAMGSLLASVAHELNNPLAVIMLQADLLREEASGDAMAEHVEEITQAATRFRVELPVGEAPATTSPALEEEIYQPVCGQTILIVDDEPSVIRGLTRLLRRDGHTVDTAPNGRMALARLQERAYDLILSDLRMPELDGSSLYQALEQYPGLRQRFVFLTGDTVSHETIAFFEQTGVRWLTKPCRASEVRRTIQQVLLTG